MAGHLETNLVFVDLKKADDSLPLNELWPTMTLNAVSKFLYTMY